MNYEQRYKEILEAVKELQEANPSDDGIKNWVEEKFPELKESGDYDERIRKALIDGFKRYDYGALFNGCFVREILDWLEKQAEQKSIDYNEELKKCRKNPLYFFDKYVKLEERKSADKVEPKFKVGDWVVTSYGKVNQVIAVDEDCDGFTLDDDTYFSGSWKDSYHLWTIQDAKDGDVLASELSDSIILFKGIENNNIQFYCDYDFSEIDVPGDRFAVNNSGQHYGSVEDSEDFHPATKEQRDLLFQKMHETGYTFDFKKKELKKLKFRVGDEVITENEESLTITRIDEKGYWSNDLFVCDFDSECVWDLVEQKPAWSEEDEREVAVLEAYIRSKDWSERHIDRALGIVDELVNKAKSIKPQSTWKPSEEQLEALDSATENCAYSEYQDCSRELIRQLKKLREE